MIVLLARLSIKTICMIDGFLSHILNNIKYGKATEWTVWRKYRIYAEEVVSARRHRKRVMPIEEFRSVRIDTGFATNAGLIPDVISLSVEGYVGRPMGVYGQIDEN